MRPVCIMLVKTIIPATNIHQINMGRMVGMVNTQFYEIVALSSI